VKVHSSEALKRTWSIFVTRRSSFGDSIRTRLKKALHFRRLRVTREDEAVESENILPNVSRICELSDEPHEVAIKLRRLLGYLEWPVMLPCNAEDASVEYEEDSNEASWLEDPEESYSTPRKRRSKKRRRFPPLKTAIAYTMQPVKILHTNACLMGLTSGLHSTVSRGLPGECTTPERFQVSKDIDGRVCMALHSAANAAFRPSGGIYDPNAKVTEDSVDLSSRRLVKVRGPVNLMRYDDSAL